MMKRARRVVRRSATRAGSRTASADAPQPDYFSSQVRDARRFFLNLEPRPGRLVVVSGGWEQCSPDYRILRRSFPYHAVEFVARGQGRLRLAGEAHEIGPGMVFAYGPGVPHDIQNDSQRPLLKYFVNFTGSAAKRLMAKPGAGVLVQTSSPDEILTLFDDLIRTGLRNTPRRDRLAALQVEHLLLRIADSAVPPGTTGTISFETYQRSRAHIEQHHLRLRNLDEIARECWVDPAYLCRLFARFDHQSPYQYLVRLRMGHAAQRLQMPGTLIKQVATEMGFGDPFHFSRTFRRIFGVSPRRFVALQRRGE